MSNLIGKACEIVATLATLSGFAYAFISLFGALKFSRERKVAPVSTFTPPVSILKPLKGTDPEMYQSFRSHCLQNYPQYEIIFGVSDANDPAIAFVEKLKSEFPDRSIQLVVCRENLGTNTKVSNLAQMLRVASHEMLVVNDSDIRVAPDYLHDSIGSLRDPKVALVTCLYRAVPGASLGSHLEALGITDFAAGVLAARELEGGIHFGLGSTLAFRRQDLLAIGGFEAFSDYLADDYQLGSRLVSHGRTGTLSSSIVETYLPAYSLAEYVTHQLRWARTVRDSRPWGYAGLVLTSYLFWACLTVIFSGRAAWSFALLTFAIVLRVTAILVVGKRALSDASMISRVLLIPLREVLGLFIWALGFLSHRVTWRGESFTLKHGKLTRLPFGHI